MICMNEFGIFHAAKRRRHAVTRSEDAPRRPLFEVPIGREKTSNQYLATYTLQQAFLVTAAVDAFVKKLISEVNFGTVAKVDAEDL